MYVYIAYIILYRYICIINNYAFIYYMRCLAIYIILNIYNAYKCPANWES